MTPPVRAHLPSETPPPTRPRLSTRRVCAQIPRGELRIIEESCGDFIRFVDPAEIHARLSGPAFG